MTRPVLPRLMTVLQTAAFLFRHGSVDAKWSAWCDLNTRSPASKAGRDGQAPLHAVDWPSGQDSNLHAFAFVARCSSS